MIFALGQPSENVEIKLEPECEGKDLTEHVSLFTWWADWGKAHESELELNIHSLQDNGLEYRFPLEPGGGGEEFGVRKFDDVAVPEDDDNLEVTENTTIRLMQTPGSFSKL